MLYYIYDRYVDLTEEMIVDGFVEGVIDETIEIVWIYARDSNGNGIPDGEQVSIDVRWNGWQPDMPFPVVLDLIRILTRVGEDLSREGKPWPLKSKKSAKTKYLTLLSPECRLRDR